MLVQAIIPEFRLTMPRSLVSSVICLAAALAAQEVVAVQYQYADTTGFAIATFPSSFSKEFAFPDAGGPLEMTRTTSVGTGISLNTRTVTYSGSPPYSNPDWITGTRDFYGIANSGTEANPVMTFSATFTSPLQADAFLVFTDVEFGEKIFVRAYNGASLIPFGDLTFSKWNGGSTSGTNVNTTWGLEAGYSGLLLSGTPFGFTNPVVTLQSLQPVTSVEYTVDMGSATNSLGFNFAVPVPEPAAMSCVSIAALVATAWLRRRRGR